ncbi:hypothetical protein AV521_31020 [Streptomyces sp. IMTB 2501]|uniref:hypothetical protein n=1 Tax=Streptomyces sp. IMTB 2501 TaxID=1776340 RepID=UPI00096F043B|nr:hypothetical protein [Streptomyces sp. IMTB 2501]OLZ65507.1 hypothetical protein AV521_31020 [Streptomyces sp. IMTB 2501]
MSSSSDLFEYMAGLDPDDREDLETLMMHFAGIIKRKTRRIEALEKDYRELRGELQKLKQEVKDQGEKIQHLLARQNQQRMDVATDQDVHHHNIAEAYRNFREQQLLTTVRRSIPRTGAGRIDRRELAERMSAVCSELFGQALPDVQAIKDILSGAAADEDAERLCATAAELRRRAEYLGGDPAWVFGSSLESLSPDQREPGLGAPEEGDPEFVIAPAYRARGKVHCTQLVWTTNPDTAEGTAGP